MSEEVRIVITDESEGEGTPIATVGGGGSTPRAPVSQTEAKKISKSGGIAMGLVAVQTVTPYVKQIAQFTVSQIEVTTGNAEAQRRAEAVISTTSGLAGSIGAIAAGAKVGGFYGAAAAAIIVAVQGIFSLNTRSAEIKNEQMLEKENIALRKSRLGQSVNRSRTGGVM